MPTSRTWRAFAVAACLAFASGCAADADEPDTEAQEGALGASPAAAGIKSGSLEEEGVLLLVNDRANTAQVLHDRTKLSKSVANAIVAFRDGPREGQPRWFRLVDEIDRLPSTGAAVFRSLVADAARSGYTEAPGFGPLNEIRLSYPDNLGRPPTANDLTVEAGFDGKSPDEVRTIVRGRLTNTVDQSNESFVGTTIVTTHKAFTIAINNLFAPGSPHATFVRSLSADSLTMLGTASALNPTIIMAEKAGTKSYYARGASGHYEPLASQPYPVLMRAKIQLDPGGVRVFYPAWSARVLSNPTTVITEGP